MESKEDNITMEPMKNIFYTGIGSNYTQGNQYCYYTCDEFMKIMNDINNEDHPKIDDFENYTKDNLDKFVKISGAMYLNDFTNSKIF